MDEINKPTTLAEIADALGKTKRAIEYSAIKGDWSYSPVSKSSKKRSYDLAVLPKDIQDKIVMSRLNAALRLDDTTKAIITATNASTTVADTSDKPAALAKAILDDKQRERDGSRRLILQYVREFKGGLEYVRGFKGGLEKAISALNSEYAEGTLKNKDLIHAIEHCNDKSNAERVGKVSARSVTRWQSEAKNNGHCIPKKTRVETRWQDVPWLPRMLACYRKPQKPQITEAYAEFKKDWVTQGFIEMCPSYSTVHRRLNKVPMVVLEMGRSTGSERTAMLPFIRRDWSGASNEVWVGDGHTFKAKVRHPDHGQPFAPEVTVIIDAASRFIVGWAFSLSENQIAVSTALGNGMIKHGKPLIYYSDNGSGQTAKTIDCPAGGMLARLGVHHETGIPGNPQGRRIIEGLWDITTIAVAKTMQTFQGTGMDGDTIRKNTQAINRAKTKGEVPEFVPSWQRFVDDCEAQFDWYNTKHQHSSLAGKTPSEVYHANFDESWACPLNEDEILNLYRPFVERVPNRGEVRWINNVYFHQGLAELPDKATVRVAYDLNDANQVWVSDLQGHFICEAVWDGNKRAGMPVSLKDALKEKRIGGMEKRGQAKIDSANAERGNVIDGEVLQRVPVIPSEPVEPLKRVVIEGGFNKQEPAEKQLSYQETQSFLQGG